MGFPTSTTNKYKSGVQVSGGMGDKVPSRHMASYARRCDITSHRRKYDVTCALGLPAAST